MHYRVCYVSTGELYESETLAQSLNTIRYQYGIMAADLVNKISISGVGTKGENVVLPISRQEDLLRMYVDSFNIVGNGWGPDEGSIKEAMASLTNAMANIAHLALVFRQNDLIIEAKLGTDLWAKIKKRINKVEDLLAQLDDLMEGVMPE